MNTTLNKDGGINMHENGHYGISNGAIIQKGTSYIINNPAIVVDIESGTLIKIGDVNMSNIKSYYE